MKKQQILQIGAVGILVLAAAMSRLIPHPMNFAPIAAMGIFGGAILKDKKYAYALPLVALFISDAVIEATTGWGFYGVTQFYVYGATLLVTFLATFMKKTNAANVIGHALSGAVLFFAISNFGVWMEGLMYPKTGEGLLACYAAAIPFFKNTVLSNLVYCGLLFGSYSLINQTYFKKQLA
jgi:hypothetical protein